MSDATDVFIVGGGTAGLAAAIAPRKRGFQMMVADADMPPIDKACGEGLLPDNVDALARLGVVLRPSEGCELRSIRFLDHEAATASILSGGGPA